MNWTYGYMEIRSRVPYKKGVWASWWTQSTEALKGKGTTNIKNYMLEVDIYEIFRTYDKTPNLIQWYSEEYDFHTKFKTGGTPGTVAGPATYLVGSNPNAYTFPASESLPYEYHIYGYYWSPTEIIMTIDGKAHVTYDITKNWCVDPDMRSYHDPQHVIFNNHLFYPGVSTACVSISTAPESLPACHYIDYIRLYQKPGEGELYLAK